MENRQDAKTIKSLIRPFGRDFHHSGEDFTYIGNGELGGKASGLARFKNSIQTQIDETKAFGIYIPKLTVITTSHFDLFMKRNDLYEVALDDMPDERIAHRFLQSQLPTELLGDLRSVIENFKTPLAIRSSSLLEDSLNSPLAGIYETKMIPNNQPDGDVRFRRLSEAIKLVYASTFFRHAKSYLESIGKDVREEKMAVIIQAVVGKERNKRFYPDISGVAKSINFYPYAPANPEDGLVELALGLGKTIVDGGSSWPYSPEYPNISPPFGSISELMKHSQVDFWAVNMGEPQHVDPLKETEFMMKCSLDNAEYDNSLRYVASTYHYENDTLYPGIGSKGPRLINFAPLLDVQLLPLNRVIQSVLRLCEKETGEAVEIEFAITIDKTDQPQLRFGLLQVRPMKHDSDNIQDISMDNSSREVLAYSEQAIGNGEINSISDIVYVNPDKFNFKYSTKIAGELEKLNRDLVKQGDTFLLIGFGRWGSSDPWLGIPVSWGQISGAKTIIECDMENAVKDFSQGSHFFHNLSNLGIMYFSVDNRESSVNWEWLQKRSRAVNEESDLVRHVKLDSNLTVQVDGRSRKGIIFQ